MRNHTDEIRAISNKTNYALLRDILQCWLADVCENPEYANITRNRAYALRQAGDPLSPANPKTYKLPVWQSEAALLDTSPSTYNDPKLVRDIPPKGFVAAGEIGTFRDYERHQDAARQARAENEDQ